MFFISECKLFRALKQHVRKIFEKSRDEMWNLPRIYGFFLYLNAIYQQRGHQNLKELTIRKYRFGKNKLCFTVQPNAEGESECQ